MQVNPPRICQLRFQGHNPHHQLETIVSVLGLPPEEQLSFVTHPAARKAIMSRANAKTKDLDSFFPADSSPLALDLLRRMVSSYREQYTHVSRPLSYSSFFFLFSVRGLSLVSSRQRLLKHCSKNRTGRYLLVYNCCTPQKIASLHRSNNASNLVSINHDSHPSFSVPVGVSPGTPYHRRRGIGARVSCRPSWAGKPA